MFQVGLAPYDLLLSTDAGARRRANSNEPLILRRPSVRVGPSLACLTRIEPYIDNEYVQTISAQPGGAGMRILAADGDP